MVARRDRRPTDMQDTLKRLLNNSKQKLTTPHGIKVARPGEGTGYRALDGTTKFVDRAWVDRTESDLANARDTLGAAVQNLEATEAELAAASERIRVVGADLARLDKVAQESAEALAEATGRLSEAEAALAGNTARVVDLEAAAAATANLVTQVDAKAAGAAQSAAQARATAEQAQSRVNGLKAQLDQALSKGDNLYGNGDYEGTPNRANSAVRVVDVGSAAASGRHVAVFNKTWVGGPGVEAPWERVTVSPGQVHEITFKARAESGSPTVTVRVSHDGGTHLLGAETTGSEWATVTRQWTVPDDVTSARFYPIVPPSSPIGEAWVDDFSVVNITERANLMVQVSAAQGAAKEAAETALAAMQAAGEAQASADGKTHNRVSVDPPQGAGTSVGDIWTRMDRVDRSGKVLGQWFWDGGAWVEQKVSSAFISDLDVNRLTGVWANFSQHVRAGSIGADKVFVGVGQNLVPNGNGSSAAGWGNFAHVTSGDTGGFPGAFRLTGRTSQLSERFPVGRGEHQASFRAKGTVEGTAANAELLFYRANGQVAGSAVVAASTVLPIDGWVDLTATVTIPDDAVTAAWRVHSVRNDGVTGNHAQLFTGFSLRQKTGGDLIVDGSIRGTHIDAASVAAEVGRFINLEITGDLVANAVRTMDLEARRVFVTEDALLANAEVLGTLVANDLNVRGTLVGRDAILSGTIDVAQLNVTETMAAEIVSAMEIETKRLVVTEDAVMQHLHVVGRLVAEELHSRDITAERIRAIEAQFNELQAGNIMLTGSFRSGPPGSVSVVIPTGHRGMDNTETLGVWLTPDGLAPSLGDDSGSVAGMWVDYREASSRNGILRLRGQGGRGVHVSGGLTVSGAGGGAFITAAGSGGIALRGFGNSSLSATNGNLDIAGRNDVTVRTGGYFRLLKTNLNAYDKRWSGGGLLTMYVGSSSGYVYAQSSARKYKRDIEPVEVDDSFLDYQTVQFRDKWIVEQAEAIQSRYDAGEQFPLTAQESEVVAAASRPHVGWIADDAVGTPAEAIMAYGADGEVEGIDYSRGIVLLTPIVRRQRDKIAELEARIQLLEEER